VLFFRADGDLGLTALTATLFCGSYLFGILIADVRPRLFARPSRSLGSR
jgi:hypothetical protein